MNHSYKVRILLACTLGLIGSMTRLDAQSSFANVEINKVSQPGLLIELPNNTDIAEGTLLQKLKETGYKPETTGSMFWKRNTKGGFYVFEGVQLPEMNNQKLDLYFKIDRKSKKEKDVTLMSMLVSKGYDNFVSPGSDSATFAAATSFLNGFMANTASYSLQQDIDAQDKNVRSAEKKLGNLQDDQRSIQKKIEQLQADAVKNSADIEAQAAEIVNQRTILDALKARVIK